VIASTDRPQNDGRPTVLIIDDDDGIRDLYGHWFFAQGFQVMCAVGKEGLSLALRRERPDLIVTELKARDLCLTDLMNRLKSSDETRCIPVLVLTTSCDSKVLAETTVVGVVAVLPKLTDFGELRAWATALIPNAKPRA